MDQSMQESSDAVQRVVQRQTNCSAVMMAVVVASAVNEVVAKTGVEGVEFRPEQMD